MRRWPFGLALLVSLVVLFTPGSEVPDVSADDKLVHALMFGVLALTGWFARVEPLRLGLGLAAYAVISEVLQAALPIHRDGTWGDAFADGVGIVIALLLTATLARRTTDP